MAKKQEKIDATDFPTLDALLQELAVAGRSHIRLVKVDDQGLVEPTRQGSSLVMQPKVRVVATALDHVKNEILRYQKKWDVGPANVTTNGGRGAGMDPTGIKTRDKIIAALEARGFSVSQGEWTPESAKDALAA